MKDMTAIATSKMTEEDKAEIEKQLNDTNPHAPQQSTISATEHKEPTHTSSAEATGTTTPASPTTGTPSGFTTASSPTSGSPGSSLAAEKEREKREAAKRRAEQREKLRELDSARRKAMQDRVESLTLKMIERLRPFVDATNPGGVNDAESQAFAEKIKREADDLKLESFGVELLHTIGNVYMMRATSFMKSRKPLGMLVLLFDVFRSWVLISFDSPGFFSRLKEKGAFAKDVWNMLGTAYVLNSLCLCSKSDHGPPDHQHKYSRFDAGEPMSLVVALNINNCDP